MEKFVNARGWTEFTRSKSTPLFIPLLENVYVLSPLRSSSKFDSARNSALIFKKSLKCSKSAEIYIFLHRISLKKSK